MVVFDYNDPIYPLQKETTTTYGSVTLDKEGDENEKENQIAKIPLEKYQKHKDKNKLAQTNSGCSYFLRC
jgi:hypothetical protein